MAVGPSTRWSQGQLPPVSCPGPPGLSYKATCWWLLLVLGLEVPRRCPAVNQCWLPLVLEMGPLGKMYVAPRPDAAYLKDIRKVWSMSQSRTLIWKSHWKQIWWSHKLGRVESQGITREWATVLAQLVETQIWHLPASFVGRMLRLKQWPLPAVLPGRKLPLQLSPWCQTPQCLLMCPWCPLSFCHRAGTQVNDSN